MYTTILLAAALQKWERYSAHAAARNIAMTLAKGAAQQLHVLSVCDYPPLETTNLPGGARRALPGGCLRRTDTLMVDKLEAYVAPLRGEGGGHPSCGQSAGSHRGGDQLRAILVILGSPGVGPRDIVLGGTAQQVSKAAPCLVLLVSPQPEGGGQAPCV